ncbi:MAG: glycosyltransferase family 4 protein, partial [Nannocystaceae bacterium]|nr:glycosyltransferase family 4 protein [Nannocystaceae bacterium]
KVRDAAFVVAISDYCAAQLRRWVPPEQWSKIEVVHCGVDDAFFEDTVIDEASRELVCVGRLCPQKGQLLLVEGLARAVSRGCDVRLTLVGDGELRPDVEALIARHCLDDRVTITGWLDSAAVRDHIKRCRAFVLPSFAEGLPMVIMEALALQRPVLSTYVAAIPELVIDGDNGWLIPAGSVEHIADAIERIVATPIETLRSMGARGRARVRERHYVPTEAAKLVSKFRERGGRSCFR